SLDLYITSPESPRSTSLPYTTLFRSAVGGRGHLGSLANASVAPMAASGATTVEPIRDENAIPPALNPAVSAAGSRTWNCKAANRSEEHTSELQSRGHLVCRLLLVKK